jgi:hypothetical protein
MTKNTKRERSIKSIGRQINRIRKMYLRVRCPLPQKAAARLDDLREHRAILESCLGLKVKGLNRHMLYNDAVGTAFYQAEIARIIGEPWEALLAKGVLEVKTKPASET